GARGGEGGADCDHAAVRTRSAEAGSDGGSAVSLPSEIPEKITSEEQLDELLSRPTDYVIETFKRIDGDIIILGVAGKMGPTLARMAKRSVAAADGSPRGRRIIGVARFSRSDQQSALESHGIETIRADLLDQKQ